ncbi:TIGR02391 family protein [Geothrix paludis]|uniref:TIGR02391 family protein n=1 Tax=Geothrix paludis TaxID=2922722 RepID=UPI001FAE70C4|nr:TIGR02391 family protein [Geothrix paludis]
MSAVPCFPASLLEGLAKVLGECGSGTDISRIIASCGWEDDSGESTKWKRLYALFMARQSQDRCANHILSFIRTFLSPSRFVGRQDEFDAHRRELNAVLAFAGLDFGADGEFRPVKAAKTIPEAEERARVLRSKLHGRPIHPEVTRYCRAELLQENYFHAVFEAVKGLFQRIREMSGLSLDGAALVDKAFSSERPHLAFNTLRTETEQSEHKGFAMLLKGAHGAIRNPIAHGPKILWQGEDDAADYLTFLSMLHRKLDNCVPTDFGGRG